MFLGVIYHKKPEKSEKPVNHYLERPMMQNRPQMPQQMPQQQQQQYPSGPHPNNMQPNMQHQAQNVQV